MTRNELTELCRRQQAFFDSGVTRELEFRLKALKDLRRLITENEKDLYNAFSQDLGKPPFESYASENGFVLQELNLVIRNLKRWARPRRAYTPMAHWPARSFYRSEPYGRVLIISPWNYPFQLLFMPLVGAVAAGNCVLAKPSRHARHTFLAMRKIINDHFDPGYVHIIEGGSEVNEYLLEEAFDYIFFTGSTWIGKKVMESAARNLTPVSLELGGKSPVIVEPDSDPRIAARRIMWGKLLNAGQSCVAPDYILVHRDLSHALVAEMQAYLKTVYGDNVRKSPDYARIIDEKNTLRLKGLLDGAEILHGGSVDAGQKYVEPTIVRIREPEHPLMQEEVFGPILPLVEYHDLDDAISIINNKPRPLSLYVFTRSRKTCSRILQHTMSGTGCINETVVHFINPYLPFGGVGMSGMGRYHGKYSYQTFTYKRSFLKKATWADIPLRYPPYKGKMKLIRFFVR